ncbi:hypothetical protein [Streptomyces violascens]|uniref:hypothetical protein n=1 Tax=Streptomyces violascens TaxID=67381 RepID=UPI0036888A30
MATGSFFAADFLNSLLGMGLTGTSLGMSVLLAVALAVQFRNGGLPPGIYWLVAVLFTFALATSAGDLVAERFSLGYWVAALRFALAIAAVALAHRTLELDAV